MMIMGESHQKKDLPRREKRRNRQKKRPEKEIGSARHVVNLLSIARLSGRLPKRSQSNRSAEEGRRRKPIDVLKGADLCAGEKKNRTVAEARRRATIKEPFRKYLNVRKIFSRLLKNSIRLRQRWKGATPIGKKIGIRRRLA